MKDIELIHLIHALDGNFRRMSHSRFEKSQKNRTMKKGSGRILHTLSKCEGITQKELAAQLNIRPQSLTIALLQLETAGYIVRKRSESDKREIQVFVTKEGEVHGAFLHAMRVDTAETLFSCLNEEEKEQLRGLLQKTLTHAEQLTEQEEKDATHHD